MRLKLLENEETGAGRLDGQNSVNLSEGKKRTAGVTAGPGSMNLLESEEQAADMTGGQDSMNLPEDKEQNVKPADRPDLRNRRGEGVLRNVPYKQAQDRFGAGQREQTVGTGSDRLSEEGGEFEIEIHEADAGTRLDAYLANEIEGATRSFLQKLIESGDVLVTGRAKTQKNYKVKAGDRVFVRIPPPARLDVLPENIPLRIVYEDDDLLVVDKPKGMVVHPAPGNYSGTLVNALMYHCGDQLSSINGMIRPGIVHRIDKDTSGLLVVAKSDRAHTGLSEQLKNHSMTRFYRAVVYNNFREVEGTIDAPIGRDHRDRLRMAVTSQAEGRRAVTHYRQLDHAEGFSLIECRLETGRTHQIRVHMAYIRHPLLGDTVYGPRRTAYGAQSQMLHAGTLGFVHPVTGRYMEFYSRPPEEFRRVCERIGLRDPDDRANECGDGEESKITAEMTAMRETRRVQETTHRNSD